MSTRWTLNVSTNSTRSPAAWSTWRPAVSEGGTQPLPRPSIFDAQLPLGSAFAVHAGTCRHCPLWSGWPRFDAAALPLLPKLWFMWLIANLPLTINETLKWLNLTPLAIFKPVLNWANVCSPEHTSETSTNYDSFLNWTFSSPNMVRTVQTLLHSQLACNEMHASARTCGRRAADSMIENVG